MTILTSASTIAEPSPPIAIIFGALSFNSVITLCAILGPIPCADLIAFTSPSAIAFDTPSVPKVDAIAKAAFAPTP